jgi:hypothetical protein
MKIKDILAKANKAPLANDPERNKIMRFIKIAAFTVAILFIIVIPLTRMIF